MNFPDNLKYTNDHEWIRVEGEIGWVGITDYAQGELGDVVYVEFAAHATFGTIEAVKAVSDIYAPVSGEILEANKDIQVSPDAVNKDPYGKGWMVRMRIGNPGELAGLLDVEAYKKVVAR